jgi:mannose/fructose-specific phosphotransferase system component IIA
MKKKCSKLTEEQKSRGVIFSSELVGGGIVHEVLNTMTEKEQRRRITNLKDDKFFNNSSFKYNLIRQ